MALLSKVIRGSPSQQSAFHCYADGFKLVRHLEIFEKRFLFVIGLHGMSVCREGAPGELRD